jgi:plastocyanin
MRVWIATAAACLALSLLAAPAGAATKTVRARVDNTFSPATVSIRPRDSVTFVNVVGGEAHNVAWIGGSPPPTPANPSTDPWSFSRPFPAAGTFAFFCQSHTDSTGTEGMTGRVVVDGTAPTVTRISRTPGRSRVILNFTSSEAGTGVGTILRKSGRTFRVLGPTSFTARRGANTRTITRTSEARSPDKLTPGTYRITFRVRDAAGNQSSLKTVTFTITQR